MVLIIVFAPSGLPKLYCKGPAHLATDSFFTAITDLSERLLRKDIMRSGLWPPVGSASGVICPAFRHCWEKPRSGLPAWEELLAVDVRALLVWCCDAVCLVSVSAMTVVVLTFWLRTLCHECLSRCVKADIWGGGLAVSPGKPRVPH